jgi:hypothetical protein
VPYGAFADWAGQVVAVGGDESIHVRVVPDGEATAAAREREQRASLATALRGAMAAGRFEPPPEGATPLDRVAHTLFETVVAELAARWQEMRLGEQAALALAEELAVPEPLDPDDRATLQRCRERLQAVHDELAGLGYDVELPEPRAEDLTRLLDVLDREASS